MNRVRVLRPVLFSLRCMNLFVRIMAATKTVVPIAGMSWTAAPTSARFRNGIVFTEIVQTSGIVLYSKALKPSCYDRKATPRFIHRGIPVSSGGIDPR
jgi:hypothetical protein